jgi:rieske iron-sulfur protein
MNENETTTPGATNAPQPRARAGRREALKLGACACACIGLDAVGLNRALADEPTEQRPTKGDRLVVVGPDGTSTPLSAKDVKLGEKPLFAFPYDAHNKLVRDGSRLNKVLLIRLDPGSLDETTRARSADGVLAFSAVCTHQGCDVSEWVPESKSLLCFCHFSRFDPCQSGQVLAGPAPRSLPQLPITLERGELAVNGPFSVSPGVKKT